MLSIKQLFILLILPSNFICQISSIPEGTLTVEYGRISNMPDNRIHVAAALTLDDCIRECVDFSRRYDRYVFEECHAYNYDFDKYTCELIHSIKPMSYTIDPQTRWKTGLKY
ncbi:hypothetical protein I4U23_018469 [Adineta vaga]|nr:hypothetical protein I4U23_018469 [Adineta vaga]